MQQALYHTDNTPDNALLVGIDTLARLLQCGRASARKFGRKANAEVRIGRLSRWDINKVKKYIEELNGETNE